MVARIDTSRAASIHFICGSSGSGKSWGVKLRIKKASRLIIFDPDDEYNEIENIQTVTTTSELKALLRRFPRGALKVRLVANGAAKFNVWSELVFAWGNCVAIAEEIAGVTTPQKAPDGWHKLISRGRKRGIVLYAISQRPAECDKTVIGNATTLRAGRLTRFNDRKYMAQEMDIKIHHFNQLENLDFIEKNLMNSMSYRGRLGTKQNRKITD